MTLFAAQAVRAQAFHPPPMTREDFDAAVAGLELTSEQKFEAQAAFGFYVAERAGADRAYRAWTHWTVDVPWTGALDDRTGKLYERAHLAWQPAIRRLEDDFFDQLGSIVPTQLSEVEVSRRARLRDWLYQDKNIGQEPHGTTLNILRVIDELGLRIDERSAVTARLSAYELKLDRMLREWDESWLGWRRDLGPAGRVLLAAANVKAEADLEPEIDGYVQAWMNREVRVFAFRELNVQAVNELLPLVPPGQAAKFRAAVYPSLYPFTNADAKQPASFAKLAKMNDLTSEQQAHFDSIREQFEIHQESMRVKLNELYERDISLEAMRAMWRAQVIRMIRREQSEPLATPAEVEFEQAVAAWDQQVVDYNKQALDVITPEQRGRVP